MGDKKSGCPDALSGDWIPEASVIEGRKGDYVIKCLSGYVFKLYYVFFS